MTSQEVVSVVTDAAHRLVTVRIEIRGEVLTEVHEIEPYSLIGKVAPKLYFWDIESHQPIGVEVERLMSAMPTDTAFTPRYAVEL
jgi:hypothetical protein